jgi:threonyl-tRNA synthetase
VDFNLPERFGAFYIAPDGEKTQPVMVHRAICGSLERFLGILIESHAGHFPLWLSPVQAVVATITEDGDAYAAEVVEAFQRAGCGWTRICATRRSTTRSASIRSPRFPVLLVVGRKEAAERTVSIRRLGSQAQTSVTLDEALRMLGEEAVPPDLKRTNQRSPVAQAAE